MVVGVGPNSTNQLRMSIEVKIPGPHFRNTTNNIMKPPFPKINKIYLNPRLVFCSGLASNTFPSWSPPKEAHTMVFGRKRVFLVSVHHLSRHRRALVGRNVRSGDVF